MRTFLIRSLSIPALALLVSAATAAAQDKPHLPVSTLEMQQLIAHAQPADHARLSGHFTALAEQYTAEAKRHTSMAQSVTGNPSRGLATGMSAHCKQLAALDTQAAAAVRELAAHHQKLAAGTPSVSPTAGTSFEYMADAPGPTFEQLNALEAKASTPADHLALEAYFLTLANRHAAAAKDHVALAQTYRTMRLTAAAEHCDRVVELSRDAAKEATAAAAMHKAMAGK